MLELRNITYEVDDNNENKEILKNVSVTIDDHFVAITGPNGGGKSTLAKMIAGIIRPTSGQILLDGEDITGYVSGADDHLWCDLVSVCISQ